MAFGIGMETELVNEYESEQQKREKTIACDCWFTSGGKMIPHRIKFEDEDGIIQTVDRITLLYTEKKNYSGITSFEYRCQIVVQGLSFDVTLIYYPETCKWLLCY